MKLSIIMGLILMGQSVYAQTLKERKIKQAMLERADKMINLVVEARQDLDQDQINDACKKVDEVFGLYPSHLKDIGSKMNVLEGRPNKAKNEALEGLIFFHRQSLICKQGQDSEYVDPDLMNKDLKRMKKSLKKQRRIIKNNSTGYNNSFSYRYEF